MSDPMNIALSGMTASALRASSAASNIANASSTTSDGKPYAGTDVVQTAQPQGGVSASIVPRSTASSSDSSTDSTPDASIDVTAEVVALRASEQTYQANAKVLQTTSATQKKLLDTYA